MQVVIMATVVREIVTMSVRLTTAVCCQSLHMNCTKRLIFSSYVFHKSNQFLKIYSLEQLSKKKKEKNKFSLCKSTKMLPFEVDTNRVPRHPSVNPSALRSPNDFAIRFSERAKSHKKLINNRILKKLSLIA